MCAHVHMDAFVPRNIQRPISWPGKKIEPEAHTKFREVIFARGALHLYWCILCSDWKRGDGKIAEKSGLYFVLCLRAATWRSVFYALKRKSQVRKVKPGFEQDRHGIFPSDALDVSRALSQTTLFLSLSLLLSRERINIKIIPLCAVKIALLLSRGRFRTLLRVIHHVPAFMYRRRK